MQSRGNGVRRGSKSQFPENTKILKGQDLFLGSLTFLTKGAPTPRLRSNIYMRYDIDSGKLLIDELNKKSIAKLDLLLGGRMDSSNVVTIENDDSE